MQLSTLNLALSRIYGGSGAFSPLSLFSAGEQGAWYDPSDMTTLFQDAAGTTPVTAVEQPVSLMLDKSKGGVGTNGAKRVNLLTYTEQFDNAYWEKGPSASLTANNTTAPDNSSTADKITATGTDTLCYISVVIGSALTVSPTTQYTQTVYVKAGTATFFNITMFDGSNGNRYWFNLSTGTVASTVAVGSGLTNPAASIQDVGNGWYRCTMSVTTKSSTTYRPFFAFTDADASLTLTSGKNGFIWGADFRLASEANTLPTYQRITDTWYNTQAGNHAYTPSTATASRPVLSARVNLLTKTQELNDAAWTRTNLTATDGATDPLGGSTADTLAATSANGTITQSVTAVSADHVFSVWLRRKTGTGNVDITCHSGGTWVTQSITSSWARYTVTQTLTAGARTPGIRIVTSGDEVEAWGADLRVANDGVGIPSYQRVNTSSDYDTVGFPMYLRFDGSDDYMLTNAIDFSGGDAMTVAAALRKNSDAALGVVAELSATSASNNGTFLLSAPNSAAANFNYSSKGTTAVANTVTTYTAPISAVIIADSDISSDSNNIRINGGAATAATSDQGSGNYGNYAMYIGRKGGASDAFSGRLYGQIVRAGAVSEAQASSIATYLNNKAKIY